VAVEAMLLFVGLGNPGPNHAANRHNVGFMAVQAIARRHNLSPWRRRFQGVAVEGNIADERALLLLPGTYMNESGRAVAEAMHFYKLEPESVAVFHDEVDLPPAKVRVKIGGSDAGHNGLRSITAHLGNDYRRVRIGIGKPEVKERVPGHVLGDFAKSEWAWVEALCDVIADNAPLLIEGKDSTFQNKVHLAMEAKGFDDDDDLPAK
jgi:PTH1 family peptidyl-tRNA hydrolase